MKILKESSDYLEMKKASIDKEISELNDKICSRKKHLDEIRREKYDIDFQKGESEKRINSIKRMWIFSFIIIIFTSIFTYSIDILLSMLLFFFEIGIVAYLSKSIFREWDTYTEQHRISVEKQKEIEDYNEIINQDYEKLKNLNKKYNDYNKGLQGENDVTETLKELGYDNYLINDVTLDRAFGNIDHILVSRYGIFIIETKNWDGEIICDGDEWKKHYINDYESVDFNIISLTKRLKGNAKQLRLLIEGKIFHNLMNVWVEGIIVFTNPDTKLRIINPTIPILAIDELNDYIKRQQPFSKFSSKDLESIANLIHTNVPKNP